MIVACGDSMSVGVGDSDYNINPGSWVKYYCQMTLQDMAFIAKNGTTTREFVQTQLPQILNMKQKPEYAFISIGGNDVLRSRFSASDIFDNICKISIALKSVSIEPVFVEIINTSKVPILKKLRNNILLQRCDEANVALRRACRLTKAKLVTLDSDFYKDDNFHIDRIHFNSRGYINIALKTADILNHDIVEYPIYMQSKWNKIDKISWLIVNGTPWFMKRSVDLLPGIIYILFHQYFLNRRRPK